MQGLPREAGDYPASEDTVLPPREGNFIFMFKESLQKTLF